MSTEDVGRLELVGLAAWQVAEELRQVRERFPEAGDTVARLAREVEEVSRTLAGECVMRLREAAGRVAIAEHDRPLPHLLDTAPKLYDVLAQVMTHWRWRTRARARRARAAIAGRVTSGERCGTRSARRKDASHAPTTPAASTANLTHGATRISSPGPTL